MCWLYLCIVVLDKHLVLLVLAELGICVGYMCLCVQCLCLVLAALWLYVKSGAWHASDAKGEWPLLNSKPFPTPVELWDTCM